MANVFMPITGETDTDIKQQIYELVRYVYEDKIGGAMVGDVFRVPGDTLELSLSSSGGLGKEEGALTIQNKSDGGTQNLDGGVSIKLADSSLTLSSNGLEVTKPAGITTGKTVILVGTNQITVNTSVVHPTSQIFAGSMDGSSSYKTGQPLWVSDVVDGVSFIIQSWNNIPAPPLDVVWMIYNA